MSEEQSQEYRGNGQHTFETVIKDVQGVLVDRLRVPGGWLYRDRKLATMAYVPMPEVVKHKV